LTPPLIHRLFLISGLWLVIALTGSAIATIEINLPQLPADEDEAQRMLGEGTLDSSVWRKVEPFYTMPVRVPQGDLRILQDLFLELPADLPVAPRELAQYFPWHVTEQQKFFSDYPELIPFKPILSFENDSSVSAPAQAGFYFSRWGSSAVARQYALFAIGDPSGNNASGRADFTDSYGRWFRRSITIVPEKHLRITGGNFSPVFSNNLFTGYFPANSSADTEITENWLHGTSRTWNGVSVDFFSETEPQDRHASAEGFFHSGTTEQIGQLNGSLYLSRQISCFGGISFMQTSEDNSSNGNYRYFQTGFTIAPTASWKCELLSGLDLQHPRTAAWHFIWSHYAENSGFKGTLDGVQQGFFAPRSEMAHLLLAKAGMGDAATDNLFNADLSFYHRQNTFFNYAPVLSCIVAGNRLKYCSATMEISGKSSGFDYRVWYSWVPLFKNGEYCKLRQQAAMEYSMPLSKDISFNCWNSVVFVSDGYWSNSLRISPCFKTGHDLELAPLLLLYGTRSGQWEKTSGIRQTLRLYAKTFSDITLEQQLPFSSWETLRARGKMSFFF
jgi:hypothetical protein